MYSVIIPTFNRERNVVEAIQSVLHQNYEDIEIIVVDDGSTDNTAQAVELFGKKVRYFFQSNGGPSSARNLGIRHATGDLISFLDSDDIWLPGKIEKEIELFRQYPDTDVVAGNAECYRENRSHSSSIFDSRDIKFDGMKPRNFSWSFSIMTRGPVCITSSMTIKREALEKLGKPTFDVRLLFDEDWDLEFRIFSRCCVLFFREILTRVRYFDDGTRLNYSFPGKKKSIDENRRIWRAHIDIIDRYLGNIDWGESADLRFRQRRQDLLELLENSVT